MREFPLGPLRGHSFRPWPLLLAACLLTPVASAQAGPSSLPSPAERLGAALPRVQLVRERPGHLVIVTREAPAQLARRYGVPAAAVTPLPGGKVTLPLPPVSPPGRAPFRPASVVPYRVQPGETLGSVAARHGLRVVELLGTNLDRSSLDDLRAGETLWIPTAERGLLVRLKPGQTALSVLAGYGADLAATARANGVLPTTLGPGDFLLLPGVFPSTLHERLLARREAEEAARQRAEARQRERERLQEKYERQARYEAYLAQRKARLQEKYDRYAAYLAWKNSPQRQQLAERYERQAQYEAALAARAAARRERERQRAEAQAAARSAPLVRPAGVGPVAGLRWPVHGARLTSRFGEEDIDYHKQVFHGGIDLAAPAGTPVYAAAGGTVVESGHGAYGLNVLTQGGGTTLVYGHLSRTAVRTGQVVAPGELLGFVGCTGICTGPHLHFEVRPGGQAVDPLPLLP
ncbi:peptidase M23 [Deinococcus sp. RL]|uniref:peptidoglycan DD-metalloendopeptidase family protein n=1 Tax=Deinococcus sp. RL TaxID=1489678 RepID=UPI0004D48B93|nr:peptidoglycan DD-metalloendopeptidase family protein [Deinococcus sp. RL]KEF35401.1 peptidase M23 [Deinococcus sp. RL]